VQNDLLSGMEMTQLVFLQRRMKMHFEYDCNKELNRGCLHPVACVRSGDGDFYIRLRNVTIVD
jgi:hypothetical protein